MKLTPNGLSEKISQLAREGYPQKQAVAVAYAEMRKAWREKYPVGKFPSWLAIESRGKNPLSKKRRYYEILQMLHYGPTKQVPYKQKFNLVAIVPYKYVAANKRTYASYGYPIRTKQVLLTKEDLEVARINIEEPRFGTAEKWWSNPIRTLRKAVESRGKNPVRPLTEESSMAELMLINPGRKVKHKKRGFPHHFSGYVYTQISQQRHYFVRFDDKTGNAIFGNAKEAIHVQGNSIVKNILAKLRKRYPVGIFGVEKL